MAAFQSTPHTALTRVFIEGDNLVFWNDPDVEFTENVEVLLLDYASMPRSDEIPPLKAKQMLEVAANECWLFYCQL